jgi:hypothetical protein
MRHRESTQELWKTVVKSSLSPNAWTGESATLPSAVQRYLRFAIAPGTPLASTVRLKMHGEIKLGGWHPFVADQVISWDRGMIWQARIRMYGLPITGSDRLLFGKGAMHWKLFGILPFMHAEGADITRSGAGRMNIESLWLPSILSGADVGWSSADANHITARFTANNEDAVVESTIADSGELKSGSMPRWGNAGGGPYRLIPFGALVEQSGTFGGFTIPTRLRVGWFFGTDRFNSEGEFFRVTIDDAKYI